MSSRTPNRDHYGLNKSENSLIDRGVMFEFGNYEQNRFHLGKIDLAILSDLGYTVANSETLSLTEQKDSLITGGIVSIKPGLPANVENISESVGNIFSSTDGPNIFDGSKGINTVKLGIATNNATVSISATGVVSITDRTGSGGTDTLTDIEVWQFNDRTFNALDFTGGLNLSNEQFKALAEMYVAYFNRAPDAEGLFFWADQLSESLNMKQIAERFFDQDETRAIYTDPSNTDAFVTAVYDNVLGRTPDEGGFAFWKARLAEGDVTQGAFVLTIINSAKNIAGSSDVAYLSDKTDLGIYYSAIKGLSDGTDGRQVMAAFGDQETSNKLGAKTAIDGHYADATTGAEGEFLFNVVGVVSNPFAEFV